MPQGEVTKIFICTGCATRYPRHDAAFEWKDGEQVHTDTCWRCWDAGEPVARPKRRHDDMHSSWGDRMGSRIARRGARKRV